MSSILIVDDRPANLRAFEATLAPLGQPIICAASGEEALKRLLEPEDFAVVLMDVRMPELDGFQTVRMIRTRERTRRIPVIFVSGYTPDEAMIAHSYGYGGVADFVLKPFNPDVLRAKVALFVELAKMREEVRQLSRREAERKAAETERQRLYQLLQRAPAAILVLRGPTHITEFVSEVGERMGGGGDLLGRSAAEAFPALARQGIFTLADEVFQTGESRLLEAATVEWKSDKEADERSFTYVFQAARSASGEIEGVLVFGFDVTEQVRARELRERLLAIIGHDLRNPLSAVTVSVSSLLRTQRSESEVKTLKRLQSSAGRMDRMISQILDFSAAQQGGGLKLGCDKVDLRDIIRQTAEELGLAHPDRPIAIEIDGDLTTLGDADRLAQVTSNLIGNAIQHGDGSGVLVRAEGTEHEVVVRVQNQGALIPAGLLSMIFEPFRQANSGEGASRRSVGLGLYIAREIVLAHGGDIQARSPDETGKTSFIFRLPKRA